MMPRDNKEKAVAVFLAITFVMTSFFYVSQPVRIFAQIPIPTQITTPVAPGAPLFIADLPTAAAFPKPVVTLADFWGMFLQGVIKAAEAAGYTIIRKYVRQGLSNLTRDVWKQLLTGGKGQQEMFRTEPWDQFWQQAGDEAVGSAVEGFAQGFQNEYEYQKTTKANQSTYQDKTKELPAKYDALIEADIQANPSAAERDWLNLWNRQGCDRNEYSEECVNLKGSPNSTARNRFNNTERDWLNLWNRQGCDRNEYSEECVNLKGSPNSTAIEKYNNLSGLRGQEREKERFRLADARDADDKAAKLEANEKDANLISGNVGALSEASRIFMDVVCKPEPNIAFGIFLGLGDQIEMKKRKPICPLNTLKENWKNVLSNTGAKLDASSLSGWNALAGLVNPNTSDLGVAWKLSIGGQNISSIAKSLGETGFLSEATVGQIKNLTDYSGKTNTPASVIKSMADNTIKVQVEEDTRFIPTGHLIADLILTAGSTVLSTSLNILTEGLRKKKAIASRSRKSVTGEAFAYMTRGNDVLYNPSANPSFGGVEAAEARLAEFNKLDLSPPQDWNILATLTSQSCPEGMEGGARGGDIDACVMDDKFAEAVKERITVKEAISRGLIDKNGVFGFDVSDKSTVKTVSWQRNFPYRSLVIMRKYRVLPVSWELAALYIQEKHTEANGKCGGGNCTLGILIEKSKDNTSPFYGMIDENWVLKIPPVQCVLKGYGSEIQDITTSQGCEESNEQGVCTRNKQVANVTRRPEQCVDIRTCLDEEEEGKCNKGRFGYCIQEQKIIRFKGEQCDAQFDGCELFHDVKANQQALYIKQSLVENADFASGACTPQNAGCQWYSNKKQLQTHSETYSVSGTQMILLDSNNLAQTAIDDGIKKEWSINEKVYFASTSDKLEKCEPKAEGCRAVEGPAGTPQYLRLPPSSLRCGEDGVKESGKTVQWYKREDCKQYTQLCKPEYDGCKQYVPENDTIAVTGTVSDDNRCPAACANIYNYVEQKTLFDSGDQKTPERFVNFNAQTAQKCSIADVGCEEFTNLDTVSRGGEGKEYYTYLQSCKKEENIDNIRADEVFYSFVGSDTAGGQPQKYYVEGEETNKGYAPKCADSKKDCDCSAADAKKQDPRIGTILCREFINSKGNPFYRYTDNLIYRTTDCSSYRRTVEGQNGVTATYSPQYSRACSAQAAGCREYRAPQAGNVRVVLPYDNFESGNVGEWRVAQPEHSKLSQSNEGEIIGDHSLKIEKNGSKTASRYYFVKQMSFNRDIAYSIHFKMKGARERGIFVQVFVESGTGARTLLSPDMLKLSNGWQTFEFSLDSRELQNDGSELQIIPFSEDENTDVGDIFIDDIVVKETKGVEYLIRDSWRSDSTCFQGGRTLSEASLSNAANKDGWNFSGASNVSYSPQNGYIQATPTVGDNPKHLEFYKEFYIAERGKKYRLTAEIASENNLGVYAFSREGTNKNQFYSSMTAEKGGWRSFVSDIGPFSKSGNYTFGLYVDQYSESGSYSPVFIDNIKLEETDNRPAYPNCSIYTDKQGGKNSFMSFNKVCPNEMAGCVKVNVPFYSSSSGNDIATEFVVPDPAKACRAEDNKCTAYGSPKFHTTHGVMSYDNFEKQSTGDWRALSGGQKIELFNDGETIGDHSLKLFHEPGNIRSLYAGFLTKEMPLQKDKSYNISFSVKGNSGAVVKSFISNSFFNQYAAPNIRSLNGEWQRVRFVFSKDVMKNLDENKKTISIAVYESSDGRGTFTQAFIDDIVVEENYGEKLRITNNKEDWNIAYYKIAPEEATTLADSTGYDRGICKAEDVGCREYKVGANGDSAFFRNPGMKVCQPPAEGEKDWFYYTCVNDPSVLCTVDSDCPGADSAQKCDTKKKNTCQPSFVKTCEQTAAGCRKIIDPECGENLTLRSDYGRGSDNMPCTREYFFTDDFGSRTKELCNGIVNVEQGCLLFNDEARKAFEYKKEGNATAARIVLAQGINPISCRCDADPAKSECGESFSATEQDILSCYDRLQMVGESSVLSLQKYNRVNTDLKYDSSKYYAKKAPTDPGDSTIANDNKDANILVKVKQDRNCKLWTSCAGSYKEDGRQDPVCFKPALCDKWGGGNSCVRKIDTADSDQQELRGDKGKILSMQNNSVLGAGQLASLSGIARPDYLFPNANNYTTSGGYGFNFENWDQGVDANVSDRTYTKIFSPTSSTANRADFNITNSCRLYPQQNSTQSTQSNLVDACRTTSGSWGVYGFCLEPYPTSKDNYYARNNFHRKVCTNNIEQNCATDSECGDGKCGFRYYDNACLTWFPVDRIRGQQNLFVSGRSREMSMYNGPEDVYYCAQIVERPVMADGQDGRPEYKITFQEKDTPREPVKTRSFDIKEIDNEFRSNEASTVNFILANDIKTRKKDEKYWVSITEAKDEQDLFLIIHNERDVTNGSVKEITANNEERHARKDIAGIDFWFNAAELDAIGSAYGEADVENEFKYVQGNDSYEPEKVSVNGDTLIYGWNADDKIINFAISMKENIDNECPTMDKGVLLAIKPNYGGFNGAIDKWLWKVCRVQFRGVTVTAPHPGEERPVLPSDFYVAMSIQLRLNPVKHEANPPLQLKYKEHYCRTYVAAVKDGNAVPDKRIESFDSVKEGAVQLPSITNDFEQGHVTYKKDDFSWTNCNPDAVKKLKETDEPINAPDDINISSFNCETAPPALSKYENRIDGPKADRNIKVVDPWDSTKSNYIGKVTPFKKMYEYQSWVDNILWIRAYWEDTAKAFYEATSENINVSVRDGLIGYWNATKTSAKKPKIYGSTKTDENKFGYDPMESTNFDEKTIKFWFYVDYNEINQTYPNKAKEDTAKARRAQLPLREVTVYFDYDGNKNDKLNFLNSEKDGKGFANIPSPSTAETGDIFSGYGPFSYTYSDSGSAIGKKVCIEIKDNWGAESKKCGTFSVQNVPKTQDTPAMKKWNISIFTDL